MKKIIVKKNNDSYGLAHLRSRINSTKVAFKTLVFLLILITTACEQEKVSPKITETTIEETLLALGGESNLDSVATMKYIVNGEFIEPHQEGEEIKDFGNISASYSSVISIELNSRKLRYDWNQDFIYPFAYQGSSTIIVNNEMGSIAGAHGLGSKFFGFDAPVSLYSSRLEAILKNQLMANPLELIKGVRSQHGHSTEGNFFFISLGDELSKIEILIDSTTHLPLNSRILEADFLMGDQYFEVKYSNWKSVNGLPFPADLEYWLGENLIRRETISEIEFNPIMSSDVFTVNTESPYNANEGRYGILSSQWYHRMFAFGFSQDFPIEETHISNVGDNVYLITGGAELAYAVLAVEFDDGIFLVEPALNQRRSNAVLKAVKNEFPGKAILGVASTHHHMDHFGGVRTFAQESGHVYIGESSVDFVEQVLNSTHKLLSDNLQNNPREITVHEINQISELGSGPMAFTALPLTTPHSKDMLVFYFPSIKALYVGDVFNAGLFYGYDFYPPAMQKTLKDRAQLLLNFIHKSTLDVETLLTVHGGQTRFSELVDLTNKN